MACSTPSPASAAKAAGPAPTAVISLVVVAAVIFLMVRAGSYEKAFAYALIGGLVANFHAYIQDPMLLLLVKLIYRRHKVGRNIVCNSA